MKELTENVVITLCDEEEIPENIHLTGIINLPDDPKECALNHITNCNNPTDTTNSYLCHQCEQKVIKTTKRYQQTMITYKNQIVLLYHPTFKKPHFNVLLDYGNNFIMERYNQRSAQNFIPLPHECVIYNTKNSILFIPFGMEVFATKIIQKTNGWTFVEAQTYIELNF